MTTTPLMAVMDKPHACDGKPTWWWFAHSSRTRGEDIPPEMWADYTLKAETAHARMTEAHQRALKVCGMCPLALACLQASWDSEQHGTYGGMSETERFAFGGKGRDGGNDQQTPERRERILERMARRFGDEEHPVVEWLRRIHAEMPDVRGLVAARELATELADEKRQQFGELVMRRLEGEEVA